MEVFFDNLKENPQIEVEFKVFLDSKDRNEIKSFHNSLKQKIIDTFGWKEIFNWELEDIRYFDKEDKKESKLYKLWIYLIRIRKETEKDKQEKNIFTIKKEQENGTTLEYETEVSPDFEKELETEYNLKEIKRTRKKRQEFEFEINWKKVKIAFDEYLEKNENDWETYDDNSKILPFFEIEASDEKTRNEALKEIKKLFPEKNFKITEAWPRKIKKFLEVKNLLEDDLKQETIFVKLVWETISKLLEEEDIFKLVSYYLEDEEKIWDFELDEEFIKKAKRVFKIILTKNINFLKEKNENVSRIFHRIIWNYRYYDDKREFNKKFNDRLEREFSWYIRAFLKIILKAYKEESSKKTQKNNLEKRSILRQIIKEKKDIFLKALFLFDDSLTREELQKVLIDKNFDIESEYKFLKEKIEKILLNQWLQNQILWEKFYEDENLILDHLITLYQRSYAKVIYKNIDNLWALQNKEILIKQNISKMIKEQFSYLSRQFSVWLNSPNRDEKIFDRIKKIFIESFFYIFILEKTFAKNRENISFDKEFIKIIIDREEVKKFLFSKNNFLLFEKWWELLKYFLENIFDENWKFTENNKLIEKIISDFREYNNEFNKKLTREKPKNDNISEIKDIKLKNFLESLWKKCFEEDWEFLKNLDEKTWKEEILKKIDFDLWERLDSEIRLKIFLKYILEFKENWFDLNENFLLENIEEFAEYKFKKIKNILEGEKIAEEYKNELEDYKNLVKNQFNDIKNYFTLFNLKWKKNIEKLEFLFKNDINSFHLLVEIFHYFLKKQKANNENKKMSELKLNYQIFAENVLQWIKDDLEKSNIEFITSTSSAYNVSIWNEEIIDEIFRRIWNDKSIDLKKSFRIKINNQEFYLKDFLNLYIPKNSENLDEKNIENYLELAMDTTRKIYNWDKIENNEYLSYLKEINFPLDNLKELKKLLEFLKLIYKTYLPNIKKLQEKWKETTLFIEEKFKNNNLINIWPAKWLKRTYEKVIRKYGWVVESISDWARATIKWKNFYDLEEKTIKFLKEQINSWNLKSIRFEDKIQNIFRKANRENGYRDWSLILVYNDWRTVEVQLHLEKYYKVKTWDIKIEEKQKEKILLLWKKEYKIEHLLKRDWINFTQEEKNVIISLSNQLSLDIPKAFCDLFDIKVERVWWKFNADFTYNLERSLTVNEENIGKNPINYSVLQKLKKLDKILFDQIAGWEIAWEEINRL